MYGLRQIALSSVLAFGLGATAQATTIYSETVSGDLDAIGSTQVNLVEGTNIISGTLPGTPPSDTDRITFVQGALMTVDSIVLQFLGNWDPASVNVVNLGLFNSVDPSLADSNFFNFTGASSSVSASFFDSIVPFTGPIAQDVGGTVWDLQLSGGTIYPSSDWQVTIETSVSQAPAIPLPAGMSLLLSGLGAFVVLRHRRRR